MTPVASRLPRHLRHLQCRRTVALALAAAAAVLLNLTVAFISVSAPRSGVGPRRAPQQRLVNLRGASDVEDKLDRVLAKKLGKTTDEPEDDDVDTSSSKAKASKKESGTRAQRREMARKKAAGEELMQDDVKEDGEELGLQKRSLDEVLAATDSDDRKGGSLARRDVYKEVGITQKEVDAYWNRREETATGFTDKIAAWGYPVGFIVFIAVVVSVYDSNVNPNTEPIVASVTGTA